jgi:Kef-type K+ transport system membrane component KefB
MAEVSDLVRLAVFLACAHLAGRVGGALRVSPLIGYILTGALLGPPLANFVPEGDGLSLIGLLGVQLSIINAGLVTDLKSLRALAPRATAIAVLGITFPISLAFGIVTVSDVLSSTFKASDSLIAAAALSASCWLRLENSQRRLVSSFL